MDIDDVLEQVKQAKERKDTVVHGQSDDLFEIAGPLYDELNVDCDKPLNIEFSDGTKAVVTYNGEWCIRVIEAGVLYGEMTISMGEDSDEYWDTLILEKGIEWMKWSNGNRRGKVKAKKNAD